MYANATFTAVMPTMTKKTFNTTRYKIAVHNAIVDLIKPAYAPRVYVRVRDAKRPGPPKTKTQCTVATATRGLIVHTVVEFYMIEREPISCFARSFWSSRTRSFVAPQWLQDAYGRTTGVNNLIVDDVWCPK